MLARAHRLTKKRDFDQLYRRGERLATAHLLWRFLPNRLGVTRIGVVMSTKTGKLATARNRHKRHIRAALIPTVTHLPSGWDILVTVTRPIDWKTDRATLQEEVRTTLKRRFSA